jgi:Sec-independent protein translocase protein TatA
MFGGGGGGFLGVGTPEVAVIAAVAWAILGPKELFKLTRQAGAFLGEWQQLGQQARDQFQTALESEIAEDEATGKTDTRVSNALEPITQELRDAVSQFQTPPPTPFAPSPFADAGPAVAPEPAELEPLGMASSPAQGAEAPQLSAEETDAMRQQLEKELGDPVSNAANFQEQMSGARNAAVLDEYPADLEAPSEAAPAAPSDPADGLLLSEEDEYDLQIAEAENALENLRAEKELLALRRKQMEANARRAAAPKKEQWFD